MFTFPAGLFGYKLIFLTELLLAEALATYTFKKRSHFILRLVLALTGVYAAAFFYPLIFRSPLFNCIYVSFMFLFLFAITIIGMKICYDESIKNLIFCGAIAYTVQHISYMTYYFFITVTDIGSLDVYGATNVQGSQSAFTRVAYIGIYGMIYWFVWAFVEHKLREQDKLRIDPLLFFSFLGIMITDIVLNAVTTYMLKLPLAGMVVIYLYSLLSCSFAMGMMYSILRMDIAESEKEMVHFLWQQDKQNYEQSRKNVELINIKCHDLKHQIYAWKKREGNSVDPAYIEELAKAVNIYDTTLKTGNDVVDVILAEKSIYVAQQKIRLSCMIDGEKLNFISSGDLYSLFGNALSNAFEAVSEIADVEKRCVRVRVHAIGRMLLLHVENYCEGNVEFDTEGLPVTQKQDKAFHGYGMRSMRMIAEKYNGALTASVEDGWFQLDISMPIPSKEETEWLS